MQKEIEMPRFIRPEGAGLRRRPAGAAGSECRHGMVTVVRRPHLRSGGSAISAGAGSERRPAIVTLALAQCDCDGGVMCGLEAALPSPLAAAARVARNLTPGRCVTKVPACTGVMRLGWGRGVQRGGGVVEAMGVGGLERRTAAGYAWDALVP